MLAKTKKEIPTSVKGEQQWLKIIKRLGAVLSHGESRVPSHRPPRVATHGQTRVDGTATTSSSPTCPRILWTRPRTHQRQTRRNTPVTEHTATEPTRNGEGPRQTQKINMGSDKAEPGNNPRQTQKINMGSARAKPVPIRAATKPRRSTRLPASPSTARGERAKQRTVNRQIIGSRRNNAKTASRRRIKSLVRAQLKLDNIKPATTSKPPTPARVREKSWKSPQFTYHFPCPKGKPSPAPVSQEGPEIQPAAATATQKTSWRLDGKNYGKTSINPPLAGVSQAALNQFMGDAFMEELKRTTINATPLELEEVANGVVHPITKETITKYKKLIADPLHGRAGHTGAYNFELPDSMICLMFQRYSFKRFSSDLSITAVFYLEPI